MPRLGDVYRALNQMVAEGVIGGYAIGGGMAALFYVEALRTYDVDVFALIPQATGPIINLAPLYEWAQSHGYKPHAEHVLIHNVPVQFLAANEGLAHEALVSARVFDYEGVPVRVMAPEYLALLAVLAGGPKRRARAEWLIEAGAVEESALHEILARFNLSEEWRRKRGTNSG